MYKVVSNGFIISINNNGIGEKITLKEYENIKEALKNKPIKNGYYAKLNNALEWELFEMPPIIEEYIEEVE